MNTQTESMQTESMQTDPNQNTKKFSPVIPEEEIKQMWESKNIFSQSVNFDDSNDLSQNKYVFYDGPPFATGLPHYGHILAGFIKDTIGRHQTMNGKIVPRKAGWDTHGLPIEYEIEKNYNINTKQQIEEWGIANYNQACKDIVLTYASEWKSIMGRLGRWVDFENDYKTMDFDFMKSVWWVFYEMAKKNLIYPSYKVMPYSVACKTPLSNFETSQNYMDVDDTTAFVKFTLDSSSLPDELLAYTKTKAQTDIDLVVWTTTPWTLPSNIAIAVGPTIKYQLVESEDQLLIMASNLVNKNFGYVKKSFNTLAEFDGKLLAGLKYKPLFDSYPVEELSDPSKAFSIISADFVTDSDGTGLVHIAPAYGEDDYQACIQNKIISKTDELFMSINEEGYFKTNIRSLEEFGGLFYKNHKKDQNLSQSATNQTDLNSQIVQKLKFSSKLFYQSKYKHSYPFCWRSDTPLMYRAIRSWFVNVEMLKERMVELNKTINWVPENIGSGRFHNWLSSAKDWCIARSRYWGTPIPIWANIADPSDYIVIGSVAELEEKCGLQSDTIKDLHTDKIDHLIFELNGKTYRRIPDVFDCWFESGSMPYASIGYPFKTDKITFPADFIAEGLDQTRGWFYTLLVISTALFDSVPFKNVVVNGLVLASDGKKMSKRLKNYPNPMDVVNKYGSDALRLYLLNSPATKADVLKFNEAGVASMVRDIIIPLKNSVNFFSEYVKKYELENQTKFYFDLSNGFSDIINPLDAYALKYIVKTIDQITLSLENYQLSDAIKHCLTVVEMLNNQYIKFNRTSLKGKSLMSAPESNTWKTSLSVLAYLLHKLIIAVAPIMPFFAEYGYQNIKSYIGLAVSSDLLSVHLYKYKNNHTEISDPNINVLADEMTHVLNLINMVFALRSKNNISMANPLEKLLVKSSPEINTILTKYSGFVLDELNVLELETLDFDWNDIEIVAKANYQAIKTLASIGIGFNIDKIAKSIEKLDSESLIKLAQNKDVEIELNNNILLINPSLVNLIIKPYYLPDYISEFAYANGFNYSVYLNHIVSDRVKKMAYGRTLATKFQKMRKEAGLHSWDKVRLVYKGSPQFDMNDEVISQTINRICNVVPIKFNQLNNSDKVIYQSTLYTDDNINNNLDLYLYE
jgi:isoleucyl-tRNA synthetase